MITTLTSAEGGKLLKKLLEERAVLVDNEQQASTYLVSIGEDPETVRPEYDYSLTKSEIDSLDLKIRKLKHAINVFNVTTVVPGYDCTVDELLVRIPQLTNQKQKLFDMAARLPKSRVADAYKYNNIIDYRYLNYDVNTVRADLSMVSDELSKAQLALDSVNHTLTFEVDL